MHKDFTGNKQKKTKSKNLENLEKLNCEGIILFDQKILSHEHHIENLPIINQININSGIQVPQKSLPLIIPHQYFNFIQLNKQTSHQKLIFIFFLYQIP
jgi:hypothetical protein